MKTKQRNICQACRKGKISCDGKQPSCSQCLFRNRACPGYSSDWVFVPQTTRNGRVDKTRRGTSGQGVVERQEVVGEKVGGFVYPGSSPSEALRGPVSEPTSPPAEMSLCDLITAIASSYVPEPEAVIPRSKRSRKRIVEPAPRICGSWVEVLPDLIGDGTDTPLAAAIKAFALSISSKGPKRSAPICVGCEAYDQALRSVNDALQCHYDSFPLEIAAAVMCLLLAELFLATSLDSWMTHLKGLENLMQLSRPEYFVSGIPHRLFVGARPALIVLSFMSRKSTFLATEEWIRIPFRETPPSPVQSLVSVAAVIPSILERLDAEDGEDIAEVARNEFLDVLLRLDAWEDDYLPSPYTTDPPIVWFDPVMKPSGEYGKPRIWFRDITVANALTHLWAFKVICLRNMTRGQAQETNIVKLEVIKRLSEKICQSTEYLMQDRMKLFGPASVILPLRTAYEAFEEGRPECKEELDWCKGILANIFSQGHEFVSLFFDTSTLSNGLASAPEPSSATEITPAPATSVQGQDTESKGVRHMSAEEPGRLFQ